MSLTSHLEKLSYFYAAAKHGSIKEAAYHLNLSQPSVSKSIKILEEVVGKELLIRLPRGVTLTQEGKILFDYCHTLFAQLKDVEVRLKTPNESMAGSIRVGTYDSIAIYFWPKFLEEFLKKYPLIDLELTTGRSSNVQKMVENGEIDLGLIIEPTVSAGVEVIELATDSFQLYRACKMSAKKASDPNTPLIFMPDAIAGERGSRIIHLLGQISASRKQFKTSSLESTKELILSGIGIGLLPKMVAQSALKKKQITLTQPSNFPKNGIGNHKIGLVCPKHKKETKVLGGLIGEIQKRSW